MGFQGDEKPDPKAFNFINKWRNYFEELFEYDHSLIDEDPSFYMATQGDREEQWELLNLGIMMLTEILFPRFIVKDRNTSYSSAQRSLIVMQILLRVKYDDADKVCDISKTGGCIEKCFE